MKLNPFLFAILPALAVVLTFAQAEHTPPQPAPELKKLDYFTGTWKSEANMKAGPMGPGGKFTATDAFKWQEGNYFLIGNSDFKSPMGNGAELMVFGYDTAKKAYTYTSFSTGGEHESATGIWQGDTLTWTAAEGSGFKWRYVQKIVSPNTMTMRFEISQDGANWSTIMEGKSTKQ